MCVAEIQSPVPLYEHLPVLSLARASVRACPYVEVGLSCRRKTAVCLRLRMPAGATSPERGWRACVAGSQTCIQLHACLSLRRRLRTRRFCAPGWACCCCISTPACAPVFCGGQPTERIGLGWRQRPRAGSGMGLLSVHPVVLWVPVGSWSGRSEHARFSLSPTVRMPALYVVTMQAVTDSTYGTRGRA